MCMDNISFTSRINFVDNKTFNNFRKGAYVDFRSEQEITAIDRLTLKLVEKFSGNGIKNPRLDVIKSDEFYTDGVRTCTAGGIVNTKTGEAAGFHIYDCKGSLEKVDDILENLFAHVKNPDRAVILGSKNLKTAEFSIPIFKKLCDGISEKIQNVTQFREHIFPYSESNLHYSAKNDTWTIHSMFRPLTDIKEFDITSRETLDKCFKEIKLANGDTLTFGYNG